MKLLGSKAMFHFYVNSFHRLFINRASLLLYSFRICDNAEELYQSISIENSVSSVMSPTVISLLALPHTHLLPSTRVVVFHVKMNRS